MRSCCSGFLSEDIFHTSKHKVGIKAEHGFAKLTQHSWRKLKWLEFVGQSVEEKLAFPSNKTYEWRKCYLCLQSGGWTTTEPWRKHLQSQKTFASWCQRPWGLMETNKETRLSARTWRRQGTMVPRRSLDYSRLVRGGTFPKNNYRGWN